MNRWPADVATILHPSYQLHTIRKNLYTCVVTLDASTFDGLATIHQISYYIAGNAPLRFGFVLTVPEDEPAPE